MGGKEVVLSGLRPYQARQTPGAQPVTIDPNGGFQAFHMYVHYVTLVSPQAKYPLLLWHGGGLSGSVWEDTPDGRKGWQTFFLNAGHDVYVSDAVERGRAGWARYPEINEGEPVFRPKSQAWEMFRIGPRYSDDPLRREIYPETLFPYPYFDQFAKQWVPRWTTSDDHALTAYTEYVQSFPEGCVIIAHSQGAVFAWEVSRRLPDKVKGLVLLEAGGILDPETSDVDYAPYQGLRALFLFGDLNTPYWRERKAQLRRVALKARGAGARIDWMEMPDLGVKGNSHMLMMDKNSDEVAAVIQSWFSEQNLMK